MRHTTPLRDLLDPNVDPLDREAHFAACEFIDYCVELGLAVPDFAKTRAYFRRNLGIRREFNLSIERDLEPVTGWAISSPGYVAGWIFVLSVVAAVVVVSLLGKH